MTDDFLYASDLAKPKTQEWRKGPKLTLQDLLNHRGVESLTQDELRGKKNGKNESAQTAGVFSFGKYRGQKIRDVMGKNPGYVRWCAENVANFKGKLEEAGIELED